MPLYFDYVSSPPVMQPYEFSRAYADGKPDIVAGSTTFDPTTNSQTCRGYQAITVGGDCDKSGGIISFVIHGTNSQGQAISLTTGQGLVSDSFYKPISTGKFSAKTAVVFGFTGLSNISVIVTSVSGNWNLRGILS